MRPPVSLRTILACLILPLLLSLHCHAQTYPGSGTEFTNGQNGTPNLPSSDSCTIDKTHFAGEAAGTANNNYSLMERKPSFLGRLYEAWQLLKTEKTNTQDNRQHVVNLINEEYLATQQGVMAQTIYTSSLYVGSEVRSGSGRPIYVLPALSYSNDKFGIELGSESFYEFGAKNNPSRDSVGVSLKVELTDLSRGLARRLATVKDAQKLINDPKTDKNRSKVNDIEQLQTLVDGNEKSLIRGQPHFAEIDSIIDGYQIFSPSYIPPNSETINPFVLKKYIGDLDQNAVNLLTDYVRFTRRPTASLIVGDLFVNDGGSLPQLGLTASQLFPLSYGGPGVTLLTAVQGFRDRTQGDVHRDATRFGAALILRDRTPSLAHAVNSSGKSVVRLGPTWNVKEGLEYTAPVFGLKETYATFVTYRDPRSYGEITLTAGKDGRRKNYLDISIGRSFLF